MVASQSPVTQLTFDLRRIAFLGVCVALLYGCAPIVAAWLFDERLPFVWGYTDAFLIALLVAGLLAFPVIDKVSFDFSVNINKLVALTVLATLGFMVMQVSIYSSFEAAFVSAYTERAGIEPEGGLRFLFSPLLMIFLACLFLCLLALVATGRKLNWLLILATIGATAFVFGLGSRNSLLWGYSGVLALWVSRLRYRNILIMAVSLYLGAVLFAYVRNNAVLAFVFGIGDIVAPLTANYFNPIIHEFGSSYRLYDMINSDPYANTVSHSAPYGLTDSLFYNMLPLAWKPDGFISFTNYLSQVYANVGEGVGSSPMTEFFFSDGWSLAMIALVIALTCWPPMYLRSFPFYRFACVGLSAAIYFNFWRIGTAELLKMFYSFVVAFMLLKWLVDVRVVESSKSEYLN